MECESCNKDIEHLEDEGCEYVYVYCSDCHGKLINKISSIKWISVKDRLPELDKWVIICTYCKYLYEAKYVADRFSKNQHFMVNSDEFNEDHEIITHWIYEDDFPWPKK